MMLPPLTFHPILKERVWGGRKLEQLYHKPLPPGVPIGESWEISDRPGDMSTIANGPLAGNDLHWLIEHHAQELLGSTQAIHGGFPLLVKILDSEEKLSLQVHPPLEKAKRSLGASPKPKCGSLPRPNPARSCSSGSNVALPAMNSNEKSGAETQKNVFIASR
jgi:mannose-6-phosphate isomerase